MITEKQDPKKPLKDDCLDTESFPTLWQELTRYWHVTPWNKPFPKATVLGILRSETFQESAVDIGELAIWLNGKIGDPKLARSLKAIKALDSRFTSYPKAEAALEIGMQPTHV
ncbi:hypothetical protein L5515_002043 [Caenorhabditis briggsae]|uniref:Uncharacterized protein n=1 Tax=Caenorhabditis briggsae TaxID=6238 RepID=A0AAE9E332_CAEBR|nr:hypothetical protein L5515_002043 [Caenorhabditis briggsae]